MGGFWPNILSLLVLIEIRIRIKTRIWQLSNKVIFNMLDIFDLFLCLYDQGVLTFSLVLKYLPWKKVSAKKWHIWGLSIRVRKFKKSFWVMSHVESCLILLLFHTLPRNFGYDFWARCLLFPDPKPTTKCPTYCNVLSPVVIRLRPLTDFGWNLASFLTFLGSNGLFLGSG